MVSALPALLLLTDRRPDRLPRAPLAALVEEWVDRPPDRPSPTSRLGRLWRSACRGTTAFPLLSTLAAAGLTAYFLVLAPGIGFDYRVEDLLPRDAESIRVQEVLKADPGLSPEFAVVFAGDREALRAAEERARSEELIGRTDSIRQVLPDGPPAERAARMREVLRLLEPLAIEPSRLGPVDREALGASLEELAAVFERALDMTAGQRGLEEVVRLLDEISLALEEAAESVKKAPPGWTTEFAAARGRVWSWAGERLAEVKRQLAAGPAREEELPPEVLERLKGPRSGRYILYLYPREDLAERPAVERFVRAARRVDPQATGYPIVFYASTSLIHRGFSTAVLAAAVVILLTLLLDFRRLDRVVLAVLPKAVGIVWMLGIMALLGIDYNLANQIVIPLLIGVGLAYGIHIIHRFFMEGRGERNITAVLQQTGGAIALSGLTTMIGFGSLALASHRGLASMGTVLFFGVGSALVVSTYVLANLLTLLYRPRR
jgi:hypothetical protein